MQSIILAAIIVVAAVAGTLVYLLWSGQGSSETIKIGFLGDLSYGVIGRLMWKGAILAVEEINAEGGILGRQMEVVGEDPFSRAGTYSTRFNTALVRLLSYHKVDFVIGTAASEGFMVQEVVAEHKRIFFDVGSQLERYNQRVLDDYDIGKYYFRILGNESSSVTPNRLLHLKEQMGFNRVGLIATDLPAWKGMLDRLEVDLPELGFDVVYREHFPRDTFGFTSYFDFTSYFARAEQAGVEIMYALVGGNAGLSFAKEYHERQSPMVIYGYLGGGVSDPEGWEITGGRCEYITVSVLPFVSGFIERFGEFPSTSSSNAYNTIRYILPDAIERAGSIDSELVVEALEATDIETSMASNFVCTPSHDIMVGSNPNDPNADYMLLMLFQWVDGEMVPVYPKKIMDEAGVTYTFPNWAGPWDK